MIATLSGQILEKLPDSLVLETSGIGYELYVTAEDWGSARTGSTARYYIYEQIREDAHNLYGFSALESRQMFIELISVSGIGPKLAMQILGAASLQRLREAIASGDPVLLKGISGVGPKTAQRVIVELRGKVTDSAPVHMVEADPAYQALVTLGYTPAQASSIVATLPPDVTDETDRIRLALKAPKS